MENNFYAAVIMKEELNYVKELLATNTVDAINVLDTIIDKNSDVFNEFISFKKRYYENLRLFQNGVISYEDFTLTFNRLILGVLTLIDRIKVNDKNTERVSSKVYESSKEERSSRLIKNQIINIDDDSKNIIERSFWNVALGPFVGIVIMLLGFSLLFLGQSDKPRQAAAPGFLISIILTGIFGIFQIFKIYYHWRINKGDLPRVHQQLKIIVKGSYDLVCDSVFRALQDLNMKITDYNHLDGIITADYRNLFLFERLYSVISGEQITIKIINNLDENIELLIKSTSKSHESIAHEGDIFGAHRSINKKNLQKIQKVLISNLSKV